MDLYSKGSNSPPLLRAEKEMTKSDIIQYIQFKVQK